MIRECAHDACGKAFEARRADARFCGASCRAAASRARRAGVGPGSVPTNGSESAGKTTRPDPGLPNGDDRLRVLEERVMDLEGDVDAAEAERDALHRLRARLEAAVARSTATVEEARRAAEAAAQDSVAAVQDELASAQTATVKRSELAELRAVVERVERRLATMEERVEAAPAPEERLDEVEQAVIKLARRMGRLREEFDELVQAIAS